MHAQQEERRRKILAQPPPVLPGVLCQETGTANTDEGLPALESYNGITEDQEENFTDNVDIDVGDWGLPSHLVSEPSPPRRRAISQPLSMPPAQKASKPLALMDNNPPSGLSDDSGRRASLDLFNTRRAWAEPQNLDLALGQHTVIGLQDGTRSEFRGEGISDPTMVPLPNSPSPPTTLRPLNRIFAITPSQQLDTFKERDTLNDSEPNSFTLPYPGQELIIT